VHKIIKVHMCTFSNTNSGIYSMNIGPYEFRRNSDNDYYTFEDFELYKRIRYGYLLYEKGEEDYIFCSEDFNYFCTKAIRHINLSKLI